MCIILYRAGGPQYWFINWAYMNMTGLCNPFQSDEQLHNPLFSSQKKVLATNKKSNHCPPVTFRCNLLQFKASAHIVCILTLHPNRKKREMRARKEKHTWVLQPKLNLITIRGGREAKTLTNQLIKLHMLNLRARFSCSFPSGLKNIGRLMLAQSRASAVLTPYIHQHPLHCPPVLTGTSSLRLPDFLNCFHRLAAFIFSL